MVSSEVHVAQGPGAVVNGLAQGPGAVVNGLGQGPGSSLEMVLPHVSTITDNQKNNGSQQNNGSQHNGSQQNNGNQQNIVTQNNSNVTVPGGVFSNMNKNAAFDGNAVMGGPAGGSGNPDELIGALNNKIDNSKPNSHAGPLANKGTAPKLVV